MGYYSPDGKRRLKSTKTDDLEEAKIKLQEQLFLNKAEKSGQITVQHDNKKSVGYIARKIIKNLEEVQQPRTTWTKIRTRLEEIIKLYDKNDIRNFKRKELRTIFEIPRSKPQLSYLRTALNKIFEYAEDEGYIDGKPTFPKPIIKNDFEKRHPIKADQFHKLTLFINKLKFNETNELRRENKELLILMMDLLISTGARLGELKELKVKDIYFSEDDSTESTINIPKSKVKKRKILIPAYADSILLGHMYDNFLLEDDYLFKRQCDKEIPIFSDVLRNIKKEHPKFFEENDLEKFVLYSLRHTFITKKITEGRNLFMIAQHCGTSVKMIEEHYSDYIVNSDFSNVYTEDERMAIYK